LSSNFKNINKRYNIEYWKNRRQYKILLHAYICITGIREKELSEVLDWFIYMIARKEVDYAVCKAKVFKNWSKHTMIQERKEIKYYYTSLKSLSPTSLSQVYYKYTSILSRLLDYTSKQFGMKNTILDSIKLKLPSNYFLNKFTKHFKNNNKSEGLRDIISRFT